MKNWEKSVGIFKQLSALGVDEYVVCGGARNAVFLEVLAQLAAGGKVKVWSHFEERSAAFFALGRVMVSRKPCAVVVTSGTAVAELLPAVIEAFYQARPLVLITADRPEEFRESGAPQAIHQDGLFGGYAEVDLTAWSRVKPLHLNVSLEEEFSPGEIDCSGWEWGKFEIHSKPPNVSRLAQWLNKPSMHGLVIALGDLDVEDQEEVFHFCESLDVPVIADAASGLREALQHRVLIDVECVLKEKPPSKILRIGRVPSGRFWRDLEGATGVDVWSICENGLRGLAREVELTQGAPARILMALGEVEAQEDVREYLDSVEARGQRIEEVLETYPDSEANWVRTLSIYAALGDSVYLGNSLPIREWNSYAQWEQPVRNIRVNRGANGIDGQLSSWLGSSADERDAWAFLGDLTTLYDLTALKMLNQVNCEGRVLVVLNNGGGQIFSKIPRFEKMHEKAREWMKASTEVDFAAIAKAFGMGYQRVSRIDEFDGVEELPGALLLEVVPDVAQDEAFEKKR